MTRRGGRTFTSYNTTWGYLFLAPWILSFLLFTLYPFVSGLKSSALSVNLLQPERTAFVGLRNYAGVLSDSMFWKSLLNVVYNQAIFIPLSLLCALVFAFVLVEVKKGALLYKVGYYMPLIVSTVVASTAFVDLIDIHGPIQKALVHLGLQDGYVARGSMTWQAMPVVALYSTWKWFGAMMIYFIAGLASIDREILEAADMDGASWCAKASKIRLPLLWPQIYFFITVNIINGLQMFTEVLVIFTTSGGMHRQGMTPMLLLYVEAFGRDRFSYATTIGIVMSLLIFAITQFQTKVMGGKE
jgi:multiple sugar transport system permease protein